MILTSPRCRLVPWTDAHAEALGRLLRHPKVRAHLLDDRLVEQGWIRARIAESEARFAGGSFGLWSAFDTTGALVGFTGYLPAPEPPASSDHPAGLELVYGLDPARWGRGLATEIARAAMEAWSQRRHDPILASVDEPNLGSARVLERLGFERTGTTQGSIHRQVHFIWKAP